MIRVLRTFMLTLLLAGVAASVATADTFPGPGSYTHGTYTSNGDVYTYGVYVPSSYRSGQHVPLLVMIHGCNTPADVQALTVEYDSLAEQHDFIVLSRGRRRRPGRLPLLEGVLGTATRRSRQGRFGSDRRHDPNRDER